ncbi:MAG: Pr6Pr family membrane protein [Bdellovibrionaceae bacterium]|nr:Pr6Pr family membrane protein [Pseudobdellovibrionaceae bacterium]
MGRALNWAGLLVGLPALVLQFAITLPASMAAGRSLGGTVVFYLSFFTILTNWAAVLVHAAGLRPAGRAMPAFFARPGVRTGVGVAMVVVLLVYAAVLARLWQPQGLFLLCDVLLHYAAPAIYVAWWIVAGAEGKSRWRDIGAWLVYPLAYLAYVALLAPWTGEVPYPFLNVDARGLGPVLGSILGILALFLVLSTAAVVADRAVSRFRAPSTPN